LKRELGMAAIDEKAVVGGSGDSRRKAKEVSG
jgi:hypothetical protein